MNHYCILPTMALMLASAASMRAQPALVTGPSSRATSQVTLSTPRPAAPMAGMPGMTPPSATASAPAPPIAVAPAVAVVPVTPPPKPIIIRLDYGQPHLRGRTLHTDSLVPYDKPWRLGANTSTTLSTDVDLVLGGATLVKGVYVLYTIPGRAEWKLVVQRSVGQTPMQYADSNDVVRIDLRHTALPAPASIESFTMWLIPSTTPGAARGELRFAWGTDQLTTNWSLK